MKDTENKGNDSIIQIFFDQSLRGQDLGITLENTHDIEERNQLKLEHIPYYINIKEYYYYTDE